MSDKPKIYQNKFIKEFHNNKEVYMPGDRSLSKQVVDLNNLRKKINAIVDSYDFIYSKKVHLVIDNSIIERKIIGIKDNNIITIDNEYIPLENVTDIY